MSRAWEEAPSAQIISVVLELLESRGYEAVQLREVARRAKVSLATVYKRFATRDELLVAAVEHWMAVNSYSSVEPAGENESLYDGLMRALGYVFEPWERNPRMLEAYYRARRSGSGHPLDTQSVKAILPVVVPLLAGADPRYTEDIGLILGNMAFALIGRFVDKDLAITDILPILERAVFRLTIDNKVAAVAARSNPQSTFPIDAAYIAPFRR